jgi:uncharacterized protein (TIGR00290 family)
MVNGFRNSNEDKRSMIKKAIFNWSGGKDSALCLYHTLQNKEIEICSLVTTTNNANNRISMHGVRNNLLKAQAVSIGIPIKEIPLPEHASMEEYDRIMKGSMNEFINSGISYSVFGDIFLEDLRAYREEKLKEAGMQALFPLWKRPTTELMNEFIDLGFKAVIVCVNAKYLDASFLGRVLDHDLIADLPGNVDPCGENGEYHSFVFDGPIFQKPVEFVRGEIVEREYKATDTDKNNNEKVELFDTRFYYMDIFNEEK